MAELSAEDAQRLARAFLTGQAGPAEIGRLSAALPEDATVALELLAQMQAALDDVAPTALTVEQDRSVDSRIEALIVPRIKKRGFMGWLKKLFWRSPSKPKAASRRRGRAQAAEESAPPPEAAAALSLAELPPPSSAPSEDDGLEDMAPIVASPQTDSAPSAPPPPPARARSEAPEAEPASKKGAWLWVVLALLLFGGLAAAAWWWLHRPKAEIAPPPAPVLTPVPTPLPTAVPTHSQPRRARSVAGERDEPLPAQLPPTTPQPAGLLPED